MRRTAAIWVPFILLANALVVSGYGGAYGADSGAHGRATSLATTLIHNVYELQNMSRDLNGAYQLAGDIDASITVNWNSGAGFAPVGNQTYPFNGTMDGKSFNITGLDIDRPTTECVGLFGNTGKNSSVQNIGVVNINVTGYICVGGLAGSNSGKISNSYAMGMVTGTGSSLAVGGLVGDNGYGSVNNSHATGKVTGFQSVGGLVGENLYGSVNNSHATGNVTGTGSQAGGLVGYNHFGSVDDSYVLGNVIGKVHTGGLVGYNAGWVNSSHATGTVTGSDFVGGLVGDCEYGNVCASYSTGNVSGNGWVGGLIGSAPFSQTKNSYSTGNVTGSTNVGGLVGTDGEVENSYATGSVHGNESVGGLVGKTLYGSLSNSYATGSVYGDASVGGLVGSGGNVENSYATGSVYGNKSVGGLVGYCTGLGMVSDSYAAGYVTGTGDDVGGLVGNNSNLVSNCFWDIETSGRNSSSGGAGKTTAEMKTRSTFTKAGWDFTHLWCMIENVTYPLFAWQETAFPVADAGGNQTVDQGTVVTFNGSGSTDIFGIAKYTWSFTDGGPRTIYGVGPTYKFDNPGIFNVTLKVTNVLGYWDNDTITVTVNDITPPVSNAGPDQVVDEGTLVTFNGSASSDNVGIVNYTWKFTDGAPVTLYGTQPDFLFVNPGIFVVTLNVTDARGHWGIDTMTVTVKDNIPPVAEAGPDQTVEQGTPVAFDGSASTDNVGVVNYSWKFIDGAPVTLFGVRPAYRFDHPGIFVVTLNVTDAAGNRGTDALTVTVNDITAPVADAGPDRIVDEGTKIMFNGSGSIDNVGVVNFTWTFTDGALVTLYGARPKYQFDNPGIFTVSLNVTDAAGNWNIDTITVTVKDITAPVADAGSNQTVDQGTVVTFNGNGSSDNVGIVSYTWTFDCGTQRIVLYGVSPSFTFDVPGVYSININVTDAAGHRDEDNVVVTVKDITPPVADAGHDRTVPAGSKIAFNGSLSTDNVAISKFYWNFTYNGKAQSLEGVTVFFKFDKPGVYGIVLTVIDAAGNRGEDRVVITVEPSVKSGGVLTGLLPVLLIAIAAAGLAGYVVMRKRKARKDGPSRSREEPAR